MTMRRRIVLWGMLSIVVSGTWNAAAQSGLVTISTPKPGITVNKDTVEVGGTYAPKTPEDIYIWVLLWPERSPGRFYPQSNDARQGLPATKQAGKWTVQCALGGPPQQYDIVAYTANREASAALSNTLKQWAKSNDYPGLTSLPAGLTEQARITIRKQ